MWWESIQPANLGDSVCAQSDRLASDHAEPFAASTAGTAPGLRLGVTVVHPGGIRTRIAETARVAVAAPAAEEAAGRAEFARLLTFPPARAAELIVAAVEHRRSRLLIGASARVPDVLARLAPARYGVLLAAAERVLRRGR